MSELQPYHSKLTVTEQERSEMFQERNFYMDKLGRTEASSQALAQAPQQQSKPQTLMEHLSISTSIVGATSINFEMLESKIARGLTHLLQSDFKQRVMIEEEGAQQKHCQIRIGRQIAFMTHFSNPLGAGLDFAEPNVDLKVIVPITKLLAERPRRSRRCWQSRTPRRTQK